MKKVALKTVAVAALLAVVSAPAVLAAEATVGLDVKSAYVFRGATYNDGFVAQPYLEVSGLPIDLGVWGNFDIDDYDGAVEDGQFSEIDIYGSYTIPVDVVDASIIYTEYTYPSGGGDADREIGLTIGPKDCPVQSSLGIYYGLDGGIEKSFYAEASVGHDFDLSEELVLNVGALVGYMNIDDGEDGFSHYELSATLSYNIFSAGVTYIDTIDDDVLGDAYDVDIVGFVGVSYDF